MPSAEVWNDPAYGDMNLSPFVTGGLLREHQACGKVEEHGYLGLTAGTPGPC